MLHKQQKHIEQKNENFNVSTVIESIKISKKKKKITKINIVTKI